MGRMLLGFLLILSVFGAVTAKISDFRRCGDPECKDPVSKGVTVLAYPSNDKDILSFPNNAQVLVYSKEAGSRRDLWGVEIKGRRGYAPLKYIREHKILKSKLDYEVPTEPYMGKSDGGPSKDNPSEESPNQEPKANEKTVTDFTEIPKVAITAEDVEYNNLPPAPPAEEHLQSEETTSHASPPNLSPESEDASQPDSDGGTTTENSKTPQEEEKEVVKEVEKNDETLEEEVEEEEQEDSQEEEEPQEFHENENIEGEMIDDSKHDEVIDASTIDNLPEKEKEEEKDIPKREEVDPSASDDVLIEPSEPPLEPMPESPQPVNPGEVKEEVDDVKESESLITLEPSSVSFEVIDGTTLYFDEDISTATTTSKDSQTSELPAASLVLGDTPTTVPIPALLHHSTPTSPPKDAQVEEPKVTDPGIDQDEAADSMPLPDTEESVTSGPETTSETVELPASATDGEMVTEASLHVSEKESISMAEETEPPLEDGDEGHSEARDIDFLDSLPEDRETVLTTEEPENEFGAPKVETIIESTDVPTEKPVESEGFFSSWFSSSETAESPEAETPETPDPSESEAPLDDVVEVEVTASEDTKESQVGGDEGITSHGADVPPDDISVPVEESESANTDVQVSHDTEDVDENVPDSSQSNLSSVENSSSATVDEEPSSDVLLEMPDNASSTDLGQNASDTAEGSEEDAGGYLGDGGKEPGPSTARPMYADPEPTIQSYTDPNVDPDELARLAATEETVRGDTEENPVEESLTEKFLKTSHNLLPEGLAFGVEAEVAEPEMSQGALVFLSIVVFTIVTIYLVHLIMLKISRETPILEALNTMDHEKRLLHHENTTLHEELLKAHSELKEITLRITESSGDVSDLDTQLELIKREHAAETAQQEEKIAQLEHALDEAANNSNEMHKILSEMLSAQKDTSTFQASVDHLQEMLDGQQEKVEALNSDLALKTRLNEELHLELSSSREQVAKLDSQVQQLTQSLKELSTSKEDVNQQLLKDMELVKELQTANESLSKQSEDYDHQLSDLKQELQTLQDTIATLRESVGTKDSELKVAKECLKTLQLTSGDSEVAPDDKKLSSLFDVITIKAELQRVSNERLNLEDQLKESEMAQKNLEDTMSSIRSEVTDLRMMHDEAIHEKQEAMSKLAVLTQYFEEKEAQLTKELESQEGLRMDAEGTAASVGHKIHNYELEVASYKAQVQSLQKELQDQENSYKAQLDSCEKKAHDNWLQARAAERKHEEQRQENSQLRNRLTLLQKEREDMQGSILKPSKRLDANGRMPSPGPILEGEVDGEHSESPPHPLHGPPPVLPMMLPPGAPLPPGIPPHHGFPGAPPPPPPPGLSRGMPPPFHPGEFPFMRPPLPPLPGDRRLPPAGGMSSPPFRRSGSPTYGHRNDRYSPSSEHSHLSDRHYSPPPLRHRPPSPDMHRRNHSPDRRSDRLRSPDRRSDRVRASPDHHRSNRRTPDRRLDRRSPDRHFSTRSPDGYHRHRSSPHDYYDHSDYNSDDSRLHQTSNKGKKTSTPLAPSDRWRNDV